MKEELEQIGKELRAWCKKYNKDYMDITYVNETLMILPKNKDKDYSKLEMFFWNKGDNNEN